VPDEIFRRGFALDRSQDPLRAASPALGRRMSIERDPNDGKTSAGNPKAI